MKKLALTNLMLLIAIKSVSACKLIVDADNQFNESATTGNYDLIFFISSFVLIVPIIILFFLRKHKGLWAIIAGIVSLALFVPILVITAVPCGFGISSFVIKAELFVMLLIFTIQLFSWIGQRNIVVELQ